MRRVVKNDLVIVISGKDRGKTGRVKRVLNDQRVVVESVNKVKRHRKAGKDFPGGIEEKEAPIHLSNVMLVDPKNKERTRVRIEVVAGKKVRRSVKSGETIG